MIRPRYNVHVFPPPGTPVDWTPIKAPPARDVPTLQDARRATRGRGGVVSDRMARRGQLRLFVLGPRGGIVAGVRRGRQ